MSFRRPASALFLTFTLALLATPAHADNTADPIGALSKLVGTPAQCTGLRYSSTDYLDATCVNLNTANALAALKVFLKDSTGRVSRPLSYIAKCEGIRYSSQDWLATACVRMQLEQGQALLEEFRSVADVIPSDGNRFTRDQLRTEVRAVNSLKNCTSLRYSSTYYFNADCLRTGIQAQAEMLRTFIPEAYGSPRDLESILQCTSLRYSSQDYFDAVCSIRLIEVVANDLTDLGDYPIVRAVRGGSQNAIRAILAQGANPNVIAFSGETPLTLALRAKDAAIVRMLLAAGASPNFLPEDGISPLILAESLELWDIAESLVTRENAAATNAKGYTAIEFAVANPENTLRLGRALLAAGANPDAHAAEGQAPLLTAIQKGSAKWASLLLSGGANANASTAQGRTAVELTVVLEDTSAATSILLFLLEQGANPDAHAKDTLRPLVQATRSAKLELMKLLLDAGAQATGATGEEPLVFSAIAARSLDAAKLLASYGAPFDAPNAKGWTPIFFAIHSEELGSSLEWTKYLLEVAKVDPNQVSKTQEKATPLIAALAWVKPSTNEKASEKRDLLTALIQAGANPNQLYGAGLLPLNYAINELKDAFWVNFLLQAGASPNVVTGENDWTPLFHAVASGDAAILDAILSRPNVKLVAIDKRDNSPLMLALEKQQNEAARKLLQKEPSLARLANHDGVTPLMILVREWSDFSRGLLTELLRIGSEVIGLNAVDKDGFTPLAYAIRAQRLEAVEALLATSGIDPSVQWICDSNRRTALRIAIDERKDAPFLSRQWFNAQKIVHALKKAGAKKKAQ